MVPDRRVRNKLEQALNVLKLCYGKRGVWAGTGRYRNTCWTRDFALAILPFVIKVDPFMARLHLNNLALRQRDNGQIPILFLDDEQLWLRMKEVEEVERRKTPFMLEAYRQGQLWNLTKGTRDSEIMFLLALYEYTGITGDTSQLSTYENQAKRALVYIEKYLMRDGLVIGADWRDIMHEELGDKALLTNNCLLYHVYDMMGEHTKATALKRRIHEVLMVDGNLIDYPGATRFDPLGGSLAVLYGVVGLDYIERFAAQVKTVNTPIGVTIQCRHNPHTDEEVEVINRTNGVVVWPFVVGFTFQALLKLGLLEQAKEQFEALLTLHGFHEWYDPTTKEEKGYGEPEQLWSAALFALAVYAWEAFAKEHAPQ